MTDLPPGWTTTTIGEVAETSLGKMLDKKQATGLHPTPYLRNINVRWGSFDLDDVASMDIAPKDLERVLARPGDVIACEGGEPGRAAVWRGPEPIAIQKALHKIRPSEAARSAYLSYALRYLAESGRLAEYFTGSTIKHLPQQQLRRVPIPLPPLAEQEHIVAAIEEHFSHLDAAEASLHRAQHNLDRLREATYRVALSADGPRVRLGDVCKTTSGGTPKRSVPSYYGGSIAWIKSGELGDGEVTRTEETITDLGLAESSAKILEKGTLLIAMYGATIGKLGRVALDRAATNQAVAALLPEPELRSDYLWNVLRGLRRDLVRAGKGGAQPNISQTILRDLEIPLPPSEDQSRICEEIDAATFLADRISLQIEGARRRARYLRSAILAAAFLGQLVPQDPTDEPASVLLDRIRAEAPTKKKSTRKKKSA